MTLIQAIQKHIPDQFNRPVHDVEPLRLQADDLKALGDCVGSMVEQHQERLKSRLVGENIEKDG